jgi:aminocarboxymuconate-semialdehyde decarboxylase
MQKRADGKTSIFFGKRDFRALDDRSWDVQSRLRDMDAEAVHLQVLSPMPELLSYWMDVKAAVALGQHVNRTISDMVKAEPNRFLGFGMVTMQDPELAARELSVLRSEYGLIGVEIGSNINGVSPGDPKFDPFFAEAERLSMPIFIHPLHPLGKERLVSQSPQRVAPFVTYPVDTGLAAMSLITGRTLEKFPRLRVAFSHGGGILAAMLPRINGSWKINQAIKECFGYPGDAARQFYYDSLVYDADFLRYLIGAFGVSQICVGTDYPFQSRQKHPTDFLKQLNLPTGDLAAIMTDNARRFLGISA